MKFRFPIVYFFVFPFLHAIDSINNVDYSFLNSQHKDEFYSTQFKSINKNNKVLKTNSWYVAPDGNDSNSGTLSSPFKTWQKAHDHVSAGDTVWVRGGRYLISGSMQAAVIMTGRNGTAQNPIAFLNYPNETPILDCIGMTGSTNLVGLQFSGKYWHLRGLEIINVPMNVPNSISATGLYGLNCENTIFENINIHHCEGSGFALYEGSKNNLVLNCDFHDNYDPETPNDPGGNSDGGSFRYLFPESTGNVMRSCRSWNNSDDGFDFWEASAKITIENCWSFHNGFIPGTNKPAGNGDGFKLGQNSNTSANHIVRNCIAFHNRGWGFDSNLAAGAQQWYNNTAYDNQNSGFRTPDTANHQLLNNIAVKSSISLDQSTIASYNSWNLSVTADELDFINTDPTGLDGPRKTNGDLPTTNFLKLRPNSDLIDKGIDVSIPYYGLAPDLGAYETFGNNINSNFPKSFTNLGPGGGGYTYSPSISQHNPDFIFLACDMAGIYRSIDGAQSWQMLHYDDLISKVKGKIQYTSNPQIMFTITRSKTNFKDPWWRGELAKSIDGGLHFHTIPDPTSTGIHRLEVDPNSTQRMLVSEYDKLFFTTDEGVTWKEIYNPSTGNMWLAGAFWDGQNIFVGTNEGLLVSKNGGQSFAIENHNGLPANSGIYQLNGAKSGTSVRLFCITTPSTDMYAWLDVLEYRGKLTGLYKMNYSSNASWTNTRNNIASTEEIALVDLSFNNINIVWAATATNTDNPQIYKSVNGGDSWIPTLQFDNNNNISTGWAGFNGAFNINYNGAALGLDVSPTDPNRVIYSDGNGHITKDGGLTWHAAYVHPDYLNKKGENTSIQKFYKTNGLDVTTSHHVFWKNDSEVIVSNTDIGQIYSTDSGNSWTFAHNLFQPWGVVSNNNWYHVVKQNSTGIIYAGISEINDIYQERRISDDDLDKAEGMLVKSNDGGISFDTAFNFKHPVVWLEIDEVNPSKIYASVVHSSEGGIFMSQDEGNTWTKLANPPRTQGHPYNLISLKDGSLVATYSARMDEQNNLTMSSGVFILEAGSNTWQDRTSNEMQYYTKDITVDPHDPNQNTWYATVWGRFQTFENPNDPNSKNGGLYRTINRGKTWTRIYVDKQAESITIHPTIPGLAYLTLENNGLFFTENLGESPIFVRVSSYPYWRPKRVFFKPESDCEFWVTSMGGGIYKSNSNNTNLPTITSSNLNKICEGQSLTLNLNSGNYSNIQWYRNNQTISGATNSTFTVNEAGNYKVQATNTEGCRKFSNEIKVEIYPIPQVSITGINSTYTDQDPDITLIGIPAGGQFKGTGVSAGKFSPSNAGIGQHEISYTYTDSNQCSNKAIFIVTVTKFSSNENLAHHLKSQIYPDPSSGQFYLETHSNESKELRINIINSFAQIIETRIDNIHEGKTILNFNNENLVSGIYSLEILDKKSRIIKRFTIVR